MTRIERSMLLCAALASAAASLSASGGPAYSLSVLVDGTAVPEYAARNRVYVEALKGKEFVLRISNPTGRRVHVWGINQLYISGGQITEDWMMFNEFDVMAQILSDEPAPMFR